MVGSRVSSTESPAMNGGSVQRGLADSLVECMGRESAIHVCQVNGWNGVLELLVEAPGAALGH